MLSNDSLLYLRPANRRFTRTLPSFRLNASVAVESPAISGSNGDEDSPKLLLEVKDLTAVIAESKQLILKGINLTIYEGEVHAVMGKNGSGKSTFAKEYLRSWDRKALFPMRILFISQGVLLGFLVSLSVSVSLCYGDDKTVEVVGLGECADCKKSNIKTSQAFSGLRVTVECKSNKEGKFKVNLPKEIIKDGKLKDECYAQLHSASSAPCPAHSGIEASKIIFQSKSEEKHTFGPTGKLKFSTALCTSAFLWPHYKYPPLPTLQFW